MYLSCWFNTLPEEGTLMYAQGNIGFRRCGGSCLYTLSPEQLEKADYSVEFPDVEYEYLWIYTHSTKNNKVIEKLKSINSHFSDINGKEIINNVKEINENIFVALGKKFSERQFTEMINLDDESYLEVGAIENKEITEIDMEYIAFKISFELVKSNITKFLIAVEQEKDKAKKQEIIIELYSFITEHFHIIKNIEEIRDIITDKANELLRNPNITDKLRDCLLNFLNQ